MHKVGYPKKGVWYEATGSLVRAIFHCHATLTECTVQAIRLKKPTDTVHAALIIEIIKMVVFYSLSFRYLKYASKYMGSLLGLFSIYLSI